MEVTASMITTLKIFVGVSLLFQCVWFGILRGLWHSISNANVAGIDKYLKMYVAVYLLYLVGGWYGNKKRMEAKPNQKNYWLYCAGVDLLFNIWFVWYAHGVHGLIDNIKKHEGD